MGARGEVRTFAVDYLRWSMPGLVAMLLIFAGTGVLRGLQDTRTPLARGRRRLHRSTSS